jgi:hypothetical protein
LHLKTLIDIAGWSGTVLVLGSYALVSSGKLQPRSTLYQSMNLVGAVGLAVNSGWNSAWPSAGLNVVWLGIALVAMRRNRRLATT